MNRKITKIKEKIKQNKILLIFILATIVRLFYIISFPYNEFQHDVGTVDEKLHLGYIYTIYKTGHLPTTNAMEFYHPPLFHFLCATILKITSFFGLQLSTQLELLQYLSVAISIISLIFMYKIIKKVIKNDKYIVMFLLVFSFSPLNIIMSGAINNDVLMIMNFLISMYLLLKWYEKSNIKNTILLAIFTGLCVFSKMNGSLIAIPILYMFIKKFTEKYDKKYIKLFALFCIISLPIGLWYPIRNYILFDQKLFYVLTDNLEAVYIGNYSYLKRFFSFSSSQYFDIFTHQFYHDYNIWPYLIKTSLFDEILFTGNIVHVFMFFIHTILIIINMYFIFDYCKAKKHDTYINCFLITIFFIYLSFFIFNIKYPYACSMNFRYIYVTSVFAWITSLYQQNKNKNRKMYVVMRNLVYVFSILSIITILY